MNYEYLAKNIIGKEVEKIVYIHDYFQLIFDDGSILNLYNKITTFVNVELIIGKKVFDVILDDEELEIKILSNLNIRMSMKKEDYNSPEAFEYNYGDLIIIG